MLILWPLVVYHYFYVMPLVVNESTKYPVYFTIEDAIIILLAATLSVKLTSFVLELMKFQLGWSSITMIDKTVGSTS